MTSPVHSELSSESALSAETVGDLHIVEQALGNRSTGLLKLSGRATYREAPRLRERLFEVLAASSGAPVIADLEKVDHLDTAAMAVLVEAVGRGIEGESDLYLSAASDAVRRVFELSGLTEALDCCFSCLRDVGAHLERSGHSEDARTCRLSAIL